MTDRTSNIVETTIHASDAGVTPAQESSVQVPAVPAKVTKPKAALSKAARDTAKQNAKFGNIGDAMQDIGIELATYTIDKELAQADLRAYVESALRTAMKKHGLQVEMLKASTKNKTYEAYDCLVNALQGTRIAAGMKPLADATRDNYMSRIKAFVRDRGANPLDLFGNYAVKAAAEKKKAAAKVAAAPAESSEGASDTQDAPSTEEADNARMQALRGLKPLNEFLLAWIDANDVGAVAEKYRVMVSDLQKQLGAVLKA